MMQSSGFVAQANDLKYANHSCSIWIKPWSSLIWGRNSNVEGIGLFSLTYQLYYTKVDSFVPIDRMLEQKRLLWVTSILMLRKGLVNLSRKS